MIGAIIGDIAGSKYEFNPTNDYHFELFGVDSDFTDDTICTVAIADAIVNQGSYDVFLRNWCRKYPFPKGGYGGSFARWVHGAIVGPYNSFGNGSAMRVASIGWLFDDLENVLNEARKSAEVTHNHPEGIRGAQTVALGIFLMRKGMDKVKACAEMRKFSGYSRADLCAARNRFDETCQGTVPQAIEILEHSTSFEDAVRTAISLGADADTIGAIVGSMAEACYDIPEAIEVRAMSYLPNEMKQVIAEFDKQRKFKEE